MVAKCVFLVVAAISHHSASVRMDVTNLITELELENLTEHENQTELMNATDVVAEQEHEILTEHENQTDPPAQMVTDGLYAAYQAVNAAYEAGSRTAFGGNTSAAAEQELVDAPMFIDVPDIPTTFNDGTKIWWLDPDDQAGAFSIKRWNELTTARLAAQQSGDENSDEYNNYVRMVKVEQINPGSGAKYRHQQKINEVTGYDERGFPTKAKQQQLKQEIAHLIATNNFHPVTKTAPRAIKVHRCCGQRWHEMLHTIGCAYSSRYCKTKADYKEASEAWQAKTGQRIPPWNTIENPANKINGKKGKSYNDVFNEWNQGDIAKRKEAGTWGH